MKAVSSQPSTMPACFATCATLRTARWSLEDGESLLQTSCEHLRLKAHVGTNKSTIRYYSIRLDSVHYCEREEILAEKRKRGAFFDRNAEPQDPTQQRLELLCRTLRNDHTGLGLIVRYFKIPYMTRETCKTDLARTVAVLPNLRYVDLPEGFFSDETSCHTLKEELQARCPQIRKMTYNSGAEYSFELLARRAIWGNLEVLDLSSLDMATATIRRVLGSLPYLRAIKLKDMRHDDTLFTNRRDAPPFPPVAELLMENTPSISINALTEYLTRPDVKASLQTILLTNSGVDPTSLNLILRLAPNLAKLSIIQAVQNHFPTTPKIPLLVSRSLRTLHYEITSKSTANNYNDPTTSYYAYLTSSLLSNGLPNLGALYVRDPNFPESLLDFAPPVAAFMSEGGGRPLSSNNPFAPAAMNGKSAFNGNSGGGLQRQLEVYTKGIEEMEWSFSKVQPAQEGGRRGSMTALRPVSAYGLATSGGQMSPSWSGAFGDNGGVRRSVVVGNGFGGYLAVPAEEVGRPGSSGGRPGSSAGERRGSRYDIWR